MTPTYLGVDEIFLNGQVLTVVSNLETREPRWMGQDRQRATLNRCFAPAPVAGPRRVRGHVGAVPAEHSGRPALRLPVGRDALGGSRARRGRARLTRPTSRAGRGSLPRRTGALCLVAMALVLGCERADKPGEEARFPAPRRPVAPIIAPAYLDERTRDEQREAERVIDRLAIAPGMRVADIGAGEGYYTLRLARRFGAGITLYAEDVQPDYLARLAERLSRESVAHVSLILGRPADPRLPVGGVDVAILAHVYHEIANPYAFLYRLRAGLAPGARVGVVDVDRPTRDHGTPPALLRCELAAVGYRPVDYFPLVSTATYLAVFVPPYTLPAVTEIRPCRE